MKKLLLSFAVITLATLLVVSACKKGNEKLAAEEQLTFISSDEAEQQQGPVAAFYKSYGPKAETYIVDAGRNSRISLPNGGSITIPAGAFSIGGRPVTAGRVDVSVLDLPSRGAMAMRGVNTMVGGENLITNGNFELQAAVAGQPVDRNLAQGRMLKVEVPDRVRNGKPLNLFEGGANNQKQFDWVPVQVPGQPNDIPPAGGTFTFSWPTTGWCNPDWFQRNVAPGTTFTTLRVDLPNNPGPLSTYLGGTGNTTVLFVPQGQNIIIHVYTATGTGVISYNNSIPIGITGRLLAYSVTAGGYFMATQDIVTTAANPMIETMVFTPTTPAALTAALTALSTY